jgi:hypothetical protein
MKKIIFLGCLIGVLCVCTTAAVLPLEEKLSKEIEQKIVKEQSKTALVAEQLDTIAAHLQKKMKQEVTPQQVVRWLYESYMNDFDNIAYYQFKWERAQKLQRLMLTPGDEEEIATLREYIPPQDPRVKEFTKYLKHVIDYSFAQVFMGQEHNKVHIYGDGPASYKTNIYALVKDKKKFEEDTRLEIGNLYGILGFLAEAEDDKFFGYFSWLLEE